MPTTEHWTKRVYPPKTAKELPPVVEVDELAVEQPCPRCHQPMQCFGNLENKIIPMSPPMEDATWACHDCQLKRKVRRKVNFEHDPSRIRFYELLA